MFISNRMKSVLLAASASLLIAACSDSSTEIASQGDVGPNPGPGSPPPPPPPPGPPPPPPSGPCPDGTEEITVAGDPHCQLSGTITSDLTLTAGNFYSLNGSVVIGTDAGPDANAPGGSPATLTIEPGVTVYGQNLQAVLIVSRGSQLVADGTVSNPITFTSAQDVGVAAEFGDSQRAAFSGLAVDDPYTSEWGGLVINGRATINTCTDGSICEADGEADSGQYGGNDDADNSGVLNYVRVLYAGNPITSDSELNGIAFQGVGSGTTIDYLQVHNGADDGIEFFGGTVNAKHVIVTGADDDSIDWTQGWRGKMQYGLVIQNPNQSSDRGIEGDGFGDGPDNLPRSAPTLSNLTFVGENVGNPGDTAILLRAGTAARLFNVVATNWPDACFDIDEAPTFPNANSANSSDPTPDGTNGNEPLTIESTLFGCADAIDDESGDPFDLVAWYLAGNNNVIGTTTLVSGFINGANEDAVTAFDAASLDPFFDNVDYIGAVPGSGAENWTTGWSFGVNPPATCPVGTTQSADGCIIEGTITGDLNLIAGLDYVLRGSVIIGQDVGPDAGNPIDGAATGRLIVDPGVTVQGEDLSSVLIVSRGSQILSNGTREAPVTFTAFNPESRNLDTDTSLWGGIVVNGRATLNTCTDGSVCEADGEADSGQYGGNDDNDDSGQMFFTRVIYAGNPITSDSELNGIAFQGVGRGTEIDYLQVHNGADDGIEFFGGTVNAKHLVVTGADDDSIDWTQGWRGRIQYALVIQNPNQSSDRGIEGDGFGDGPDNLPRSYPLISNITFIGENVDNPGDTAILLRAGTAGRIFNAVATNWADACFDIDEAPTFPNANSANASDPTPDGNNGNLPLTVESVLFDCTDPIDDENGDPFDLVTWFEAGNNNTTNANSLVVPNRGGNYAFINGNAENVVPAVDVSTIDPFFDSVDFIGAVPSNGEDFTAGWTVWIAN